MNVIIVNESTKHALVRSRRVLSKYLPQISSTTWSGHISEEGLADLKEALLKSKISKLSSICCHQVVSRSQMRVRWMLGNTSLFDEDGRYTFRVTAQRRVAKAVTPRAPFPRLLSAINRLAGLFHDTGKANAAFQDKLRASTGAEAIRHDLMSFLVHAESLWGLGVTDKSWLQALAKNPALACQCIADEKMLPSDSRFLRKIVPALNSDEAADAVLMAESELTSLSATAPALMTLLWLVLTHHRLPGGDRSAQQVMASRHVNIAREGSKFKVAPHTKCLKLAKGTPPWKEKAWLEAVAEASKHALEALNDCPTEQLPSPQVWLLTAAHVLRPSLILADHLGSKQAEISLPKTSAASKKEIYANTLGPNFGDTLGEHQLKVSRITRKVGLLLNAEPPRTSLPPGSKALVPSLTAEYQWQLELEAVCKEARPLGPVFVSVIAETGAGKTLASSRALSGLSGNSIRATFALGLRSITWQLGKSMMKDAEFPEKDVMVAVGQPESLGLDELAKELLDKEQEDGKLAEGEIYGSESSAGTAIAADAMPSEPLDHKWVEVLCSQKQALNLFGEKALDMLTTPLLACTADHLVASVSLLNGGDAKMFLRLASSDLVLDEIDAYNANDLQSIAKLAFTAGLFQKNVILLSATMSPPVQQGVYFAWKQGVEVGCAINAKPLSFASVFSSNTVPPQLLHNPSDEEAKARWTGYVGDVCAKYAHRAETCPLRRLQTYKMRSKTLKEGHAELVSIAKRLHKDNCTKDSASNSDVSIGFIRCNTASGAWKLSKFLADYQDPDGYAVKFVCYHAKYPRDYLGVLDATLGEITNRKNETDFLQNRYLRNVLDNNENKQVLIIVCTTSLIETGRDFDFDWAILEPKGNRSEVQAGGRVRRHRRKFGVPHPNMVILEEPLSNIEDPGKNLWGRPGIENELPKLKLTCALPTVFSALATEVPKASKRIDPRVLKLGQRPVLTAEEALPIKAWKVAFDAQLCLLPSLVYEDNRIGYCEQTVQGLNLLPTPSWNEDSGLPPSVGFYLSTFAPLNAVHTLRTKFRGENESTLVFIPGARSVMYWDSVARRQEPARKISMLESPSVNALVPNIEEAAAMLPGSSVHIRGCSLRCRQGLGAMKAARWDPLLGFNESNEA